MRKMTQKLVKEIVNKLKPKSQLKCEICGYKKKRNHYRICFWCHMTLPLVSFDSSSFCRAYDKAIDEQVVRCAGLTRDEIYELNRVGD